MPIFELNRLESYDDEALLAELRRVATLIESPIITRAAFDKLAKASSDAIRNRFGGWEQALARAGLANRYSGGAFAPRKFRFSDDELLAELQQVSKKLEGGPLTIELFNQHARMNAFTLQQRFGSWRAAVKKAGLEISRLGRCYSAEDYFENLLTVWTHHGRQPTYGEMSKAPSQISANAHERKWGTWRKALLAFLERVNADGAGEEQQASATASETAPSAPVKTRLTRPRRAMAEDQHQIKLGLRYQVLKRDRFRCVLCGASPATNLGCVLHVDHIIPFSKGGKTVAENLRSACEDCNLGKGAKLEI
jgi:hypothetical protein